MHSSSFSSSRPPGSRRSARAHGFTLLEILLTMAIIALLASVLVGGAAQILREQPVTPQEVFWKAVQEARKLALKNEHEVRLKFDKEKKQFVLLDGRAPTTLAADGFTREEVPLKQFPILPAAAGDLTVDFLGPSRGGPTMLIGGLLLETSTISYATFYSDGTCSPFRVQFMRAGASSPPLVIDPWTCAPMLPATDPNSRPLL